MIALNSTRGVAARAAVSLCAQCLEADGPLPTLLRCLLHRFCRDSSPGVRMSVVHGLPFIVHKDPAFGWALFFDAFREPQHELWSEIETLFRHQIYARFETIKPLLERMLREGDETARVAYGRLLALSLLAEHALSDGTGLREKFASDEVLRGAAGVFCTNLAHRTVGARCRSALVELLETPESSNVVIESLDRQLAKENDEFQVDVDLVRNHTRALAAAGAKPRTWGLMKWLERNCVQYPIEALGICEHLVALKEDHDNIRISDSIVPVLVEILKEADQSDDPQLIGRAVRLQDAFLRLNAHGVDEMLDQASVR